ncbi:hypothetical protein AB6A40_011054, partial [Gnathostoma spinigerum]
CCEDTCEEASGCEPDGCVVSPEPCISPDIPPELIQQALSDPKLMAMAKQFLQSYGGNVETADTEEMSNDIKDVA